MQQHNDMKAMVRGGYDIQKLRIMVGNRLVANFKAKLGQEPGEKEETIEEDGKQILANLREAHARITDGVAKDFVKKKDFEGDEVISSFTELHLVGYYLSLVKAEAGLFKAVQQELDTLPIWTEFLKDIKGIGPAMAGVIVSEFDIRKAKYPSSLHAYAGLDVVGSWKLRDVEFVSGDRAAATAWTEDDNVPETKPFVNRVDHVNATAAEEGPQKTVDHSEETTQIRWTLSVLFPSPTFTVLGKYDWECKGGRSRRKEHLREVEYIDKNGNPATRVGVTFNPFLKTKLMGVLAASFLKIGPDRSPYAKAYYDYKNRMENHVKYGVEHDKDKERPEASKGHRHNMAMRYSVKLFLIDLYKAWRALEGLTVHPPYAEAKLGITHGEERMAG